MDGGRGCHGQAMTPQPSRLTRSVSVCLVFVVVFKANPPRALRKEARWWSCGENVKLLLINLNYHVRPNLTGRSWPFKNDAREPEVYYK